MTVERDVGGIPSISPTDDSRTTEEEAEAESWARATEERTRLVPISSLQAGTSEGEVAIRRCRWESSLDRKRKKTEFTCHSRNNCRRGARTTRSQKEGKDRQCDDDEKEEDIVGVDCCGPSREDAIHKEEEEEEENAEEEEMAVPHKNSAIQSKSISAHVHDCASCCVAMTNERKTSCKGAGNTIMGAEEEEEDKEKTGGGGGGGVDTVEEEEEGERGGVRDNVPSHRGGGRRK